MTLPPAIDVRRTLANFPLIDTHGDSNAMVVYMSAANIPLGFYNLIERFVAFGPRFQRLKKLRGTAYEGMAVISIPHTSDQ